MNAGHDALAAAAVNPGLSLLFALAGVLILLAVLAHLAARRQGGWRAVRRRLRREVTLTATAFAAPVQTRLRYRRHLRLLVRLLRQPAGWADAERALLRAEAVRADVQAYATLLGTDVVGVLIACGSADPPRPPAPWVTDVLDPRLWWIDRTDAAGTAVTEKPAGAGVRTVAPLLVTLGMDDEHALLAVLLDLTSGPAAMAVDGEPRTARAVLQSLAAQLDARLPAGTLTIAAGVHDQYDGLDAAAAVAVAERRAASTDDPVFAVCAVAPQDRRLPDGVWLIAAGGVRGAGRLLTTHRDGGLLVHGTPLRVDAISLPKAVARTIRELPPYPTPGGPVDDLAEPLLPAHGAARRSADSARTEPPQPEARLATGSTSAAPPGTGKETVTARSVSDGTAGAQAATPTSAQTGTPTGTQISAQPGMPSGTEARTQTGTPAGTEADAQTGTPIGTPTGTEAGTPTGTEAGTPTGTEAGTEAGTPAGAAVAIGTGAPVLDDLAEPEAPTRLAGVSSAGTP
jgi:hypothetical protein